MHSPASAIFEKFNSQDCNTGRLEKKIARRFGSQFPWPVQLPGSSKVTGCTGVAGHWRWLGGFLEDTCLVLWSCRDPAFRGPCATGLHQSLPAQDCERPNGKECARPSAHAGCDVISAPKVRQLSSNAERAWILTGHCMLVLKSHPSAFSKLNSHCTCKLCSILVYMGPAYWQRELRKAETLYVVRAYSSKLLFPLKTIRYVCMVSSWSVREDLQGWLSPLCSQGSRISTCTWHQLPAASQRNISGSATQNSLVPRSRRDFPNGTPGSNHL